MVNQLSKSPSNASLLSSNGYTDISYNDQFETPQRIVTISGFRVKDNLSFSDDNDPLDSPIPKPTSVDADTIVETAERVQSVLSILTIANAKKRESISRRRWSTISFLVPSYFPVAIRPYKVVFNLIIAWLCQGLLIAAQDPWPGTLNIAYSAMGILGTVCACFFLYPFALRLKPADFSMHFGSIIVVLAAIFNLFDSIYVQGAAASLSAVGSALVLTSCRGFISESTVLLSQKDGSFIRSFAIHTIVLRGGEILSSFIGIECLSNWLSYLHSLSGNDFGIEEDSSLQSASYAHASLLPNIARVCLAAIACIILSIWRSVQKNSYWSGSSCPSFRGLIRQFKISDQILLLPLIFFIGFQSTYLHADLVQLSNASEMDSSSVDLLRSMALWFMASLVICCVLQMAIWVYISRMLLVSFAAIVSVGCITVLLRWNTNTSTDSSYLVLSAMFGATDGIFLTQITALESELFSSNIHMAMAVLTVILFVGHTTSEPFLHFIGGKAKLQIMSISLALGMTGYLILEMHLWNTKRHRKVSKCESLKCVASNKL